MQAPLLSLATIVKNESAHIKDMLRSAAEVCDELIVVDTGSTDGTQDLVRDAGARLIEVPWGDSFSEARNVALDAAAGLWILQLDGDEVLRMSARVEPEQLRASLKMGPSWPYEVFMLELRDTDASGQVTAKYPQARIFPRHAKLRYTGRVHNRLGYSDGRLADRAGILTDCWIDHYGYDPQTYKDKDKSARLFRLLELEFADLRAAGKEPDAMHHFYMGRELVRLERYAEAKEHLKRAIPAMLLEPAMVRTTLSAYEQLLEAIAGCPGDLDQRADGVRAIYKAARIHWDVSPDLHYSAGRALGSLLQLSEAHEAFEQCEARLDSVPLNMPSSVPCKRWELYLNWGFVLTEVGKRTQDMGVFLEAQSKFRQALEHGAPPEQELMQLCQGSFDSPS